MGPPDRESSPQWTPHPLRPSPWNTHRESPPLSLPADSQLETSNIPPVYLSKIQRPVQEPNELLHDFYNVAPVPFRFEPDGSVPRSVEMPLVRRTDSGPTHALAVLSSLSQLRTPSPGPTTTGLSARSPAPSPSPLSPLPSPSTPSSPYSPVFAEPLLLPIDAPLFAARFGHDAARTLGDSPAVKHSPLLRWDYIRGTHLVTLPLIPLYVPHPPSIPHLLLFGQGLPTSTPGVLPPRSPLEIPNYSRPSPPHYRRRDLPTPTWGTPCGGGGGGPSTLATYLLPISAIGEFPSAPAMAEEMARRCSEETLHAHGVFNQGLWRNVLLLAPTEGALVDVVRVAWNVTAEARRVRARRAQEVEARGRVPRSRENSRSRSRSGSLRSARGDASDEPSSDGGGLPSVSVQYVEAGGGPAPPETVWHLEPARAGRRRNSKNVNQK